MKPGKKFTITTPPLAGSSLSTSSGTLRPWSISARALEWEKMTGARLAAIDVVHRLGRDVAEVDHHAEPVHLADDRPAERGEAVMDRIVGRRIRPVVVLRMGEGHVAGAERMELAQRGRRIADLVAALDPDQRGDPPGFLDPADVGRGRGHLEPRRIAGDHPVDDVDLLERHPDRLVALQVGRDPDRPELRADAALLHPRQVGLEPRLEPRGVGVEVERLAPEIVVSRISQGRSLWPSITGVLAEDALDPLLRRLGRSGGAVEIRAPASRIDRRRIMFIPFPSLAVGADCQEPAVIPRSRDLWQAPVLLDLRSVAG